MPRLGHIHLNFQVSSTRLWQCGVKPVGNTSSPQLRKSIGLFMFTPLQTITKIQVRLEGDAVCILHRMILLGTKDQTIIQAHELSEWKGSPFCVPAAEHLQPEPHHSDKYCFTARLKELEKDVCQFYMAVTDALLRRRTTVC